MADSHRGQLALGAGRQAAGMYPSRRDTASASAAAAGQGCPYHQSQHAIHTPPFQLQPPPLSTGQGGRGQDIWTCVQGSSGQSTLRRAQDRAAIHSELASVTSRHASNLERGFTRRRARERESRVCGVPSEGIGGGSEVAGSGRGSSTPLAIFTSRSLLVEFSVHPLSTIQTSWDCFIPGGKEMARVEQDRKVGGGVADAVGASENRHQPNKQCLENSAVERLTNYAPLTGRYSRQRPCSSGTLLPLSVSSAQKPTGWVWAKLRWTFFRPTTSVPRNEHEHEEAGEALSRPSGTR